MSNTVSIKTDFHTHLLPDIDCSGRPEMSVKLLKEMKSAGIQNVVLSPHFYPQHNSNVEDFLARRDRHIRALIERMEAEGLSEIELLPAAEVLLCQGLEKLEGIEKLCIKGTNTLLIEMPDLPWSESLYDSIKKMRDRLGLEVVIAHADRYGEENASLLVRLGYAVQLNADSVCSFGKSKLCRGLAANGSVVALGSDTHVSKSLPQYKKMRKASSALADNAEAILKKAHSLMGI